MDTSNEWILSRTGIRERAFWNPAWEFLHGHSCCSGLPRAGGTAPSEVDAIIVGTVTPDMFYPATPAWCSRYRCHSRLGFDLSAGCSGFIFSLTAGLQMIESDVLKRCW